MKFAYRVLNGLGQEATVPSVVEKVVDTGVLEVKAQVEDAVQSRVRPMIIKAAIIGGGVGLVLGVLLGPVIRDLLGIRR